MRNRRRLWLACFGVACIVAGFIVRTALERSTSTLLPSPSDYGGAPFSEPPERIAAIEAAGERIRPLHAPLGPPQPGDWLDHHTETGQTFAWYRRGGPCRPNDELTTLYLQKWGTFDDAQSAVVDRVAALLGSFYGVRVRFLEPLNLDALEPSFWSAPPVGAAPRLIGNAVLQELQLGSSRPPDAAVVLAVTTVDLTRNGGGTWAFGQASLFDRVAVCSLFRQGDPNVDFTLCLKRTAKTCLHEVGHTLSIPHCAAYECAMNGSSSREESDRRPLWFCGEDEMKVWLACRLDPARRYDKLVEFAAANGLDEEARFWTRSRQALEGTAGRPLVVGRRPSRLRP